MPLKPLPVEEDEESSVEIDVEKRVMSKNPKSRGVEEVPMKVREGRYNGSVNEIERPKKAMKGRSEGYLDEEPTADEEEEKANSLERYQKGKGAAKSQDRKKGDAAQCKRKGKKYAASQSKGKERRCCKGHRKRKENDAANGKGKSKAEADNG